MMESPLIKAWKQRKEEERQAEAMPTQKEENWAGYNSPLSNKIDNVLAAQAKLLSRCTDIQEGGKFAKAAFAALSALQQNQTTDVLRVEREVKKIQDNLEGKAVTLRYVLDALHAIEKQIARDASLSTKMDRVLSYQDGMIEETEKLRKAFTEAREKIQKVLDSMTTRWIRVEDSQKVALQEIERLQKKAHSMEEETAELIFVQHENEKKQQEAFSKAIADFAKAQERICDRLDRIEADAGHTNSLLLQMYRERLEQERQWKEEKKQEEQAKEKEQQIDKAITWASRGAKVANVLWIFFRIALAVALLSFLVSFAGNGLLTSIDDSPSKATNHQAPIIPLAPAKLERDERRLQQDKEEPPPSNWTGHRLMLHNTKSPKNRAVLSAPKTKHEPLMLTPSHHFHFESTLDWPPLAPASRPAQAASPTDPNEG